jgi:hypothetical protein
MAKKSAAERELDVEMENAFAETFNGQYFASFDVSLILNAGKRAKSEGRNIKEAMRNFAQLFIEGITL